MQELKLVKRVILPHNHTMPIFTDTHAHLYLHQFDEDRAEMMQRALTNGVTKIFLPNVDSETIADLYQLADD